MFKQMQILLVTTVLIIAGPSAWADTPPKIDVPDSHSIENMGKINLYRVQMQGLEFGRDEEKVDAEILVTLDTKPEMVYTVRLHPDSPPVNKILADTLRDAYLSQTNVTLYHQKGRTGQKHVKIHMVQLNRK